MANDFSEHFVFLPLGGSGEIGMNLNCYGIGPSGNEEWLIIDTGVTFADMKWPGVDLFMPDPQFLEEHKSRIRAIVLTHAHEDHIGALGHLWRRFEVPVYATPFTSIIARHKLEECGHDPVDILNEIPLGGRFTVGPFDLEFVNLTHSIPEPSAVILRSKFGTVFHTGDWKIDQSPQIGHGIDHDKILALKKDDVIAMVCDSTNIFSSGRSGSEESVREELLRQIRPCQGRVAVASFASNVARLVSVLHVAQVVGRKVSLVGRSMERMAKAAQDINLIMTEPDPFVSWDTAADLPRNEVLYLCTGSQGEPRAALSRIAQDDHKHVQLGAGDIVLFSSKVIPGNERDIYDLQNKLMMRGIEIITERDAAIHVSGHPNQDELKDMYRWVEPNCLIPVHGEHRHIHEHAVFARKQGVPKTVEARNGEVIQLAPGSPATIDEVPAGRLVLDGGHLVETESTQIKERRKLSVVGHISIAICLDEDGSIIDGPIVRSFGVTIPNVEAIDQFLDQLELYCEDQVKSFVKKHAVDFDHLERHLELTMKHEIYRRCKKRGVVVDAIVLSGV